MTAGELIKAALRANNIVASGENPSAAMYSDGLTDLNQLCASWAAEGLVFNSIDQAVLTCVAGTGSYVVTSSFTPTTRWNVASSAFIRVSGVDSPVKIISRKEYDGLKVKTTEGQPEKMFYDPDFSSPTVYLYPVPGDTYSLYVEAEIPFGELATTGATVSLPDSWLRALKWNLAVEISSGYGAEITQLMMKHATDSKRAIERVNVINRISPSKLNMPGIRESFSIYEG